MVEFEIRPADWSRDRVALEDIRTRVFIEEQKVPVELEWDGLDACSAHVLALFGDTPIGTGRLAPGNQIGRMAVLAYWRGRGVGARLLAYLVNVARERGGKGCRLDAQVSAIGFYERFGFRIAGEEFMDAGIPHRTMTLEYRND